MDKETLVFVEVKARTSLNTGHPFEAIDEHKLDLFVKLYCIYTGDSEKRVKASIKEAMKDEKGTIVSSPFCSSIYEVCSWRCF